YTSERRQVAPAPSGVCGDIPCVTETWRENLVGDDAGLTAVLRATHRIAVLGIKPESHMAKAAHYVPRYMAKNGYAILPVPVYYPDVTAILGAPVYRTLQDVPGPIDLVNVFRKSEDLPPHVPDILAAHPKAVWFQLGIQNQEVAETLAQAGIKVVQNHCLMVEHERLIAGF
ncbi:MAG TPA: CoA-binding protein, partial [Gemmatimonadales bacterium]